MHALFWRFLGTKELSNQKVVNPKIHISTPETRNAKHQQRTSAMQLFRILRRIKGPSFLGGAENRPSEKGKFHLQTINLTSAKMLVSGRVLHTWIFQICKISAFWLVFWLKRHKFYKLGRSRYCTC